MSTKELLEIVKRRGLRIVVEDGRPILKRPQGNQGVTDRLLAVLKRHKDRIVELLSNAAAIDSA